MAVKSWMSITDWKTEDSEINLSNLIVSGCYSTDLKREQILFQELKSLKYFDNNIDLDASVIQSKLNDFIDEIELIHYDPLMISSKYCNKVSNYPDNCFITTRSTLSKIMNTPFEINQDKRKWIIKAEVNCKGNVHLNYDTNSATIDNTASESFDKHFELLKNYLFKKKPYRYYSKITSVMNEIFGEMYRMELGEHKVAFTTETPGVISNQEITNLQELRLAEHIYYDLMEAGDLAPEVINFNPIWWSKATLINAKQCIIGVYNKDNNCIQEIIKFNRDKFDDKRLYENTWSPNAAWNFLNDFLQFVKEEINRVPVEMKDKCVWIFQSFKRDKPYVSCETMLRSKTNDLRETVIPFNVNN